MGESAHSPASSMQALIERHSPLVYRLAYVRSGNRHDAEDVFQEVFLRCVKAQPVFHDEEHERAFLIRVTVNVSRNLFASAWRRRIVPLEERMGLMQDPSLDGEYEDLLAALNTLPQKSRTILHLFYYENMTAEEIAKALHIPPSSVRVSLSRTRKKLKICLTAEEVLSNV